MDIEGILGNIINKESIDVIAKKTGVDKNEVKNIAAKALPKLLGGLQGNAKDTKKADEIKKTISEKHDGSIFENLESLDINDGAKIVGHIFPGRTGIIEKEVGNKDVLNALAPLLLGALGKGGIDKGNNIDILSSDGLVGKLAKSLIDKDKDGDIKNDLLSMAMNFFKGKK